MNEDENNLGSDEDDLDKVLMNDVAIKDVTVLLTEEQGEVIKDLITEIFVHPYNTYCMRVQVKPPNFYTTMKGTRPCSLEFLNKILSGIGYEAKLLNPVVQIQELETGKIVVNADSIEPDEE